MSSRASVELDRGAQELEYEVFGSSGEAETGLGAASALVNLVGLLSLAGNLNGQQQQQSALRIGQRQLDASGAKVNQRLNKPDVAFLDAAGRRVNIEIDTNAAQSRAHQNVVNRDQQAKNLYLMVDPWSGQVKSGQVRDPRGVMQPLRAGQVSQLNQALDAVKRGRNLPAASLSRLGAIIPTPQASAVRARPAAPSGNRGRAVRQHRAREFEVWAETGN